MDADLTSEAVRNRSFGASLRGYDRDEVDRFREAAALRIETLEAQLAEATARLHQLGIAHAPALGEELSKVGADISMILDEARRAATDMRERAAADAAAWREAADADTTSAIAEAEATATELRSHAWREGSDLLDLAQEEAERIVAAGRQDVLFIRAEAEREVLRMTGEARREAEELMRAARADADQISAAADAEAELVIAEAQQSVAAAVARTEALEQRRTALLQEIEAAQLSLDAMQLGGVEAQRIVRPGDEPPEMEWSSDEDDGGVKIVSPPAPRISGPVDADELAAEVEQLRSSRTAAEAEAEHVAPAMVVHPEPETPPVVEAEPPERPSSQEDAESGAAEPAAIDEAPGSAPVVPDPDRDVAVVSGGPVAGDDAGAAPMVERAPEQAPEPVEPPPSDPAGPEPPGDAPAGEEPLAGLFAQLRMPDTGADPEPLTGGTPDAAASREASDGGEPAEAASVAPGKSQPAVGFVDGEGAFELRDRLLLPIENAALRAVKRHLVDLQNRVLEELRTAGGVWEADPDEFLREMSDDIVTMRRTAYAAGVQAAADLTGRGPLDIEAPPGDPATRVFAESLIAAVANAHAHAVRDEAGSRELASAISRVFRAWRTDEAERRLRSAAYRSYHEGQLDGFAAAGVAAVTAVTSGRPCAECPAGVEWAPGARLPAGTELPPAHVDCTTTIVPAGMAD